MPAQQAPLILSTGALARYPLQDKEQFSTRTIKFADFSRQTFANLANPLKSWVLNLALMKDQEVSDWRTFWRGQQGAYYPFAFIDPWDNLLQYSEQQETSSAWHTGTGTFTCAPTSAVADPFGGFVSRPRLLTCSVPGYYYQSTDNFYVGGIGNSRTLGMTLTFSTWILSNGSSPSFQMEFQDGGGYENASVTVTPTASWQRLSVTHQFSAINPYLGVSVFYNFPASGAVYLFGSQLEASATVSGYKQTSSYCGFHPKCYFATDEFDHQVSGFDVNTINQLTIEESN